MTKLLAPFSFIFSLFSCRRYTERASKNLDTDLPALERAAMLFHHVYCFICRRFTRQITVITAKAKKLADPDHRALADDPVLRLSEDARRRISQEISRSP